jgi:cytochrome c556
MTMDDQFLHRLRREPPADFAIRLKWQLDRPLPTPRFKSRLILALAICGTAFALVSPPGHRVLGDWFATTTSRPQTAPAEISSPAPSTAVSARASRVPSPPGARQPRYVPAVPSLPAPQLAPVPAAAELEASTTDTQSSARPAFVPVPIVAGSLLQPPEMQAAVAVSLRQGLFLNLGFVTQPLSSMLQHGAPLDFGVIRTSATRLQTLSSLIPEVVRQDTRPFVLNTRARDSIWAVPKEFESKADELISAADSLATAAATDDDVAALSAIGRIEAACNACHDGYRRK